MKKLRVTVDGKTYDVEVEILEDDEADSAALPTLSVPRATSRPAPAAPAATAAPAPAPAAAPAPAPAPAGDTSTVTSPIAGIIVEYKAQPGTSFKEGQILVVIEAMKMNTNIHAPTAGTVKELLCKAGDSVKQGQVLLTYQ